MTASGKKTTIFLVFSFIILSILFIRLDNDLQQEENKRTSDNKSVYYTVKEYDGHIAIFINDETQPQNIFDSYVSTLPEKDRERLKKGITVSNKEELQRIIEDYTS